MGRMSMVNAQRRWSGTGAPRARLAPLVAGLLALALSTPARAQPPPATPPGLQSLPDVPRRDVSDAGPRQTEVDVQKEEIGRAHV